MSDVIQFSDMGGFDMSPMQMLRILINDVTKTDCMYLSLLIKQLFICLKMSSAWVESYFDATTGVLQAFLNMVPTRESEFNCLHILSIMLFFITRRLLQYFSGLSGMVQCVCEPSIK